MDETGMTTIMISFAENQAEADYAAQLLPAIVAHNIDEECAQEWFTMESYNRVCDIEYDKESNTFISPDEKMMDYLLLDERQGPQVEVEGMPDLDKEQVPKKPRGSDQSFASFRTTLGKKTPAAGTGSSPSSPTDISKMMEIARTTQWNPERTYRQVTSWSWSA